VRDYPVQWFERQERTFLLDEELEVDLGRRKAATGHASRHEIMAGGYAQHALAEAAARRDDEQCNMRHDARKECRARRGS
jgi:hypothetical protein